MTSRTSYWALTSVGTAPYSSSGSASGFDDGVDVPGGGGRLRQGGDDVADDLEGMLVVLGQVVGDAGDLRVHVAAAEFLGRDDLADRGLHQRRAAQEDGALVADDHGLVAHRGDVGAAGGAGAHHGGDLRDLGRGHLGLVEEDPAEVLLVREDLVLLGQEGPAGVHEVDAGQPVLQRDFLGPEVLLDRHRVVGAALDGGVVGDDQHLAAVDQADPGDDPGAGRIVVVHAVGGQRRDLQERAAVIEQLVDAFPRQELAAGHVAFPGLFRPAQGGRRRGVPSAPRASPSCASRFAAKAALRGVHLAGDCLH